MQHSDTELVRAAVYALGSLCENVEVKNRLVELGAIITVVQQLGLDDLEIKRAAGYFLATITEHVEYHNDLQREGALETIIA